MLLVVNYGPAVSPDLGSAEGFEANRTRSVTTAEG